MLFTFPLLKLFFLIPHDMQQSPPALWLIPADSYAPRSCLLTPQQDRGEDQKGNSETIWGFR